MQYGNKFVVSGEYTFCDIHGCRKKIMVQRRVEKQALISLRKTQLLLYHILFDCNNLMYITLSSCTTYLKDSNFQLFDIRFLAVCPSQPLLNKLKRTGSLKPSEQKAFKLIKHCHSYLQSYYDSYVIFWHVLIQGFRTNPHIPTLIIPSKPL